MARNEPVARVPLFDRLVDEEPDKKDLVERRPQRTLDQDSLRESVRRDLSRLLNTRTSVSTRVLAQREPTVLDYGIPELSDFAALSAPDRTRLQDLLARQIEAFEPRLRNVRLELELDDAMAIHGRLSATLRTARIEEPFSFRTVFHRDGIEVTDDR